MSLRAIGGWALLGAGVLGLVMPVIPGIPLLAAGAAMLGSAHWLVCSGKDWLRSKGLLR
jgi:uncharacterized protein YqgC (DUF456 family)